MYYEELKKAVDKKFCIHQFIMGAFNAKLRVRNTNGNMKGEGQFGLGGRIGRNEKILDFAEENNPVISNSFFQKVANRQWTWEAQEEVTKTLTDIIMSSDRKTVRNREVTTNVDKGVVEPTGAEEASPF